MSSASVHDAFPQVYCNGQFLPAQMATISSFDRGLLYGDGVFETLRIHEACPLHWDDHFDRLRQGADFLHLTLAQSSAALRAVALELIQLNHARTAMLRITLTRGIGPRGYSTGRTTRPTLLMTLHHAPPFNPAQPAQWRIVTSEIQVRPDDPLTRFKTCNRLPYVLARHYAEAAHADDALILTPSGELVETSAANLFWLQNGSLRTIPADTGALPGITRAHVLQLAPHLGLSTRELAGKPDDLLVADAVFLTLTSLGIVEVIELDRQPIARSTLVQSLHAAYWKLIESEILNAR